ncbi:TIGR03809 family protein [Rhodoplanes sp. TEM]|uniref:TIGR03809 family protein n=1 Tax=Rhodoplanes tepidamans TaxID=200616 RepID=A0ABT5JHI0_RHOTP|nr:MULTISPECIES: TIGR03809 family protein [Rhodoplanes]MDC7788963.1 TIGR03809 family protein [Rhodoplanes tepidamans]MDC7987226.1 TIGR03809 family protein [Rhodoplanes sp. TEM]MDQ0358657.1 putative repeat protein (TIGR03809 family) [Rhodoplanes tepidamans]
MHSMIPRAISAAISRRGLMLAERRRAHLVELYKTGRWKRYFDEHEFLSRMREAVHEVELWTAAMAPWDEPSAAPPDTSAPAAAAGPEFRIAAAAEPAPGAAAHGVVVPAGVLGEIAPDQSRGASGVLS